MLTDNNFVFPQDSEPTYYSRNTVQLPQHENFNSFFMSYGPNVRQLKSN